MTAAKCGIVACAMCILVSTGARSDPAPKAMSTNDGQMRPGVEALNAKPAPLSRPKANHGAEKVKSQLAPVECAVCAVTSQIEKNNATERATNEAMKKKTQQRTKLERDLEKTLESREQARSAPEKILQ